MKKIKVGDKVCANCGRYLMYYEKGFHNFYPCGYGVCNVKNEIIKEKNTCLNFCKRECQPISVIDAEKALKSIKEIEKLLNSLNETN